MPTPSHFEARVQETLEDLAENKRVIKGQVAQDALESEEPYAFLRDVAQYGCLSGCYPSLIYYRDTHVFFDRFYNEINELYHDWVEERGQPLTIEGDLKTFLVYFSVEQRIHEILSVDLGQF